MTVEPLRVAIVVGLAVHMHESTEGVETRRLPGQRLKSYVHQEQRWKGANRDIEFTTSKSIARQAKRCRGDRRITGSVGTTG